MPLAIALQHRPRPGGRAGAQDPHLPRLHRHHPRGRAGGTHPGRPHGPRYPTSSGPTWCRRRSTATIAAAFAIVAAVIGLMAGVFARFGWIRPRPDTHRLDADHRRRSRGRAHLVLAVMAWLRLRPALWATRPDALAGTTTRCSWPWRLAIGCSRSATVVGFVAAARSSARPDRGVRGGVAVHRTGIVAAAHQRTHRANVFGGVTGAGTDFLVAGRSARRLRHPGRDVRAGSAVRPHRQAHHVLRRLPHPRRAWPVRTKARFPQGEYLIDHGPGRRAATDRQRGGRSTPAVAGREADARLPGSARSAQPFHRLNPLTKLVLAIAHRGRRGPPRRHRRSAAAGASWRCVLPAHAGRGVAGRLIRLTLLLSLPIAVSALLVNVFFFPGGQDVLFAHRAHHRDTRKGSRFAARDACCGSWPSRAPSPCST